jgi:hypothetical protein
LGIINKIKIVTMGLLDKVGLPQKKDEDQLSPQELEFIMKKMRSATYVGDEFEIFYTVFVKLTKELQQANK